MTMKINATNNKKTLIIFFPRLLSVRSSTATVAVVAVVVAAAIGQRDSDMQFEDSDGADSYLAF